MLDKTIDGARRQNRTCIVIGDWNAVVGPRQEGDDEGSVGTYGVGCRNERGQWLAQWASTQRLTITNTCMLKPFEDQWTHSNGSNKRQIDFALICTSKAHWIDDAGANEAIGVGNDHRTVYLHLKMHQLNIYNQKADANRRRNLKGWKPEDKERYRNDVDAKLPATRLHDSVLEQYKEVEKALLIAGKKWQIQSHTRKEASTEAKKHLRELIGKRREARKQGNTQDVKRYSKFIQKEIKAVAKARKTTKICELLEEFRDIGQIKDLKKKGKKECINAVINDEGKEVSDVKDIAEAFADFYQALYKESVDIGYDYQIGEDIPTVRPVQPEEIRAQLKKMKKGKAADETGIVSELLCEASAELVKTIADIFTSILKPGESIPPAWKSSSIRVLFKKGDPRLPENYRPVCIIPIIYKIFSKVICERIKDVLLKEQSWDQAGFRPGFSCDDHEECNEFNIPLWVAAIDFSKAFDSISHRSIFEALQKQGVPAACLDILARLYKDQHAHIGADQKSRDFLISKGTKQGYPISPLIFNAVLEGIMRKVKEKWRKRKYGIELQPSYEEHLTNLRFADDLLLIGKTLPQIKQMLMDMAVECAKVGLNLHPGKTKILHNDKGYGRHVKSAQVGEMVIEVLEATASTVYLGRLLSLTDPHEVELQHRLKKGWAKFAVYKEELTNKEVSLKLRMRLFNAVVTPTILYGCSSWVLTASKEKRLQTTQMKMTRTILGRKRKVDEKTSDTETWISWAKRTTAEARETMKAHKISEWTQIIVERQEKWKGRLENQDPKKWTKQANDWIPIGFRRIGRPAKRWKEDET